MSHRRGRSDRCPVEYLERRRDRRYQNAVVSNRQIIERSRTVITSSIVDCIAVFADYQRKVDRWILDFAASELSSKVPPIGCEKRAGCDSPPSTVIRAWELRMMIVSTTSTRPPSSMISVPAPPLDVPPPTTRSSPTISCESNPPLLGEFVLKQMNLARAAGKLCDEDISGRFYQRAVRDIERARAILSDGDGGS